jgi:hypothetical protein
MTALDDHRRLGDQYTFVALDPETKIVPAYPVGKRDLPTATAFITDLSERLANRATSKRQSGLSVQISITARWLNFTKLSQWDGAGIGRRALSVRNVPWLQETPIQLISRRAW